MPDKLIFGVLIVVGLVFFGSCRLSKKATTQLVKTLQLNTLTVKNLSEEVTKNDEIEIHVFLLDHRNKILTDTLILLEFTKENQSKNIPYLLPIKSQSNRVLIALIEQDHEIDASKRNHQVLNRVFSDPEWKNGPLAELALSKQLGDDDLLGIETINFYAGRNSPPVKQAPVQRIFDGSHLMDRYEYLLKFTIGR